MADLPVELFAQQDAISGADVVEFWVREHALERGKAERRVPQVLSVGVTREGELAAVSSAFLVTDETLGVPLWHHRAFVGAAHRRDGWMIALLGSDLFELERRFTELEDRRGAGTMHVVQNPGLVGAYPTAVLPLMEAAFVSRTAAGDPRYVRYFPGALAPEPWPAVAAVPPAS